MSSTAENSTTNTGNIIPQLQEQQGQQEQQEHQEQQEQTTQERVVLSSTQGGTSKSKVRGKRKSWVWDHFDKIECKDNSDQRATRYRIISTMARDVLAMPVSTVASESAFSTGGRILDSFRSTLTPRLVEALICGQDWFRSSSKSLFIEHALAELESVEIESSCDTTGHAIIQIDD